MSRFLVFVLAWLFASDVAVSMEINGQLVNAQLQKLTSNPTCSEARIFYDTDDGEVRFCNGSSTWLTVADSSNAVVNPMDSAGDLIVGGSGGAATKLDAGTSGQILQAAGAASPVWNSMSGDVTINSSGVTAIGSGVIVRGDFDATNSLADTSGNAGTVNPYSCTGVVCGQSYSPGVGNTSNATGVTLTSAAYARIGPLVIVGVRLAIGCTTASPTQTGYSIDLPIASAFTSTSNAWGSGSAFNTATSMMPLFIEADAGNDRIQVNYWCTTTNSRAHSLTFMYMII